MPQPHQIRAVSVTYTTAHGNIGPLTCWARPGIEPASSWILVRFISAGPWWERPPYWIFHTPKWYHPSYTSTRKITTLRWQILRLEVDRSLIHITRYCSFPFWAHSNKGQRARTTQSHCKFSLIVYFTKSGIGILNIGPFKESSSEKANVRWRDCTNCVQCSRRSSESKDRLCAESCVTTAKSLNLSEPRFFSNRHLLTRAVVKVK